MEEMPLVGMLSRGTCTPKASLARSAIFACTSWPSTSAVGSAASHRVVPCGEVR